MSESSHTAAVPAPAVLISFRKNLSVAVCTEGHSEGPFVLGTRSHQTERLIGAQPAFVTMITILRGVRFSGCITVVEEDIFVVGLAGASGSGKSTVSKRVAQRLNGHVISMEVYSLEMNHLPLAERARQNYDAPHAIDVKLLENHIREYAAGRPIEAPIYDFAEHLRVSNRREHISARSLLIVEGILALHFAELRPYFNLSIYLEAPDEVCFHRRKVRDITERGRSLDFIQWQYKNTVLPAARQYLLPSKRFANLVIDAERDLATVESSLYEAIVKKRSWTQDNVKTAANY